MKSLSSLDIHYLVKEMQFLIGAKIDKIYHPEKKELVLQFHVANSGKSILKITDKLFYLSKEKKDASEPSGFCMFLRKRLDNSRLAGLNQINSERIIELYFETKEGTKKLIVELFGGGNFILCDEKGVIISALEFHKFKGRDIFKDVLYQFPERGINLFEIDFELFKKTISQTDKESIVKFIAIALGLGGIYSEEACLSAGIDKNKKPNEIKDSELKKLYSGIRKLIEKAPEPKAVYENEKLVDVIPIPLEIYTGHRLVDFKTFSEAIDFYSSKFIITETKHGKEIEKVARIVDSQQKKIEEMRTQEAENREKAEAIYNNYSLINEIIAEINKAKEKYSWEDIRDKLKGHKTIKELDVKDKKIVIDL